MGCASSTQPMITTAGSEMLKAATHVASDATKKAEDAVQGARDTMGKTLETVKEGAETVVHNVKQEVAQTVHEKTEMLEEAKNTILNKLHLDAQQTTAETKNNSSESKSDNSTASTIDLATKLETKMENTAAVVATDRNVEGDHDQLEDDSLSMSSQEIARAFANVNNVNDDDYPATPKSHLTELTQFTDVLIPQHEQQIHNYQIDNDTSTSSNNNNSNNPPKVIDTIHPLKHATEND